MPYLTGDGASLYFASNRSGSYLLYESTVAGGNFGAPAVIPGIAAGGAVIDIAPVMSADRLTLYFASTRLDGTYKIHVARRTTPSGTFGTPTPVTELNASTSLDVPSWISPDLCRLYMWSSRVPANSDDIYLATRSP
jgi:hypothetical protein